MPRFEVLIPAAPPEQPFHITLRVESETWLPALKAGLQKICGAQLAPNILCDVGEDGAIDVTDPSSGRVFRISELAPDGAARGAGASKLTGGDAVEQAVAPPAPAPRRIGRTPHELHREELLADLFLRAPLVAEKRTREEGLAFLLDLALEKVPSASGAVLLASDDAVLRFAVARGARAEEALKRRVEVPVGVGILGFCAQESVGMAVSDPESHPLFDRLVSDAVRSTPRSLLAVPIALAARVHGCLELVDKRGGGFDEGDVAAASYLAHQAARFLAERAAREAS
jgi:hypothetical protein